MFKSLTEKVHSLLALVAKPKDQLSRVEHLQKIQNEIKTVTQSGTPFLKKELRDCLDEAQDKYKKAAASMRHFCQLFKTEFTKSCPSITLQDNETPRKSYYKRNYFCL